MIIKLLKLLDWFAGGRRENTERRHRARMVAVTGFLLAATSGTYLTVWLGLLAERSSPISVGMLMLTFIASVWGIAIVRYWDRVELAAFVMVCAVILNLSVSSLVQGGFVRLQIVGLTLTPLFIAYVGGIRWSIGTASLVFLAETALFIMQLKGIEFERMVDDDLMAMDALASGLTGAMFVVVFSTFYVASILNSATIEGRLMGQLEEIRSRTRLKADFVSVLGHELETPLRRIKRRLKRSEPIIQALGDERQIKNLSMLIESTTHLRTIIGDLLDLERIESGTITRSDFSIHVEKLVKDVVNSHRPAAEKKGLQLFFQVGVSKRLVTDPVRVRQILDNLVTNAIKYSDSGAILLRARGDAMGIYFDVIDQGIGIPKENLVSIFEPMYQVDQSTTRRVDGVGLGLYIVRQLVQLLGGHLKVRSQVGKGTTFTLSFPARMIDPRT